MTTTRPPYDRAATHPDQSALVTQIHPEGGAPQTRRAHRGVSLPRILFIVPGLVAGMLLPAVGAKPKPAPASTVGMLDELFDRSAVTVHRGDRLTLVNSSGLVHVIGPGRRGRVITRTPGVPVVGFHLMETNGVDTTDRWERPGTYYLTCSVHPKMTLKVVVGP